VRKPTALLAALTLTVGLAACSDDSGDDDAADDAGDTATTAAPSDGDAEAPADGETVTVDIGDFAFEPTPVEISAGQSIVWENTHTQAHTATGNGDQEWDTQNIAPGESSEPVLFEDAGSFTYICALHPFMEGTVKVSA
jgi:plastocyanin